MTIGVYCTLMEKEQGNHYIDTNWKLISKDNRDKRCGRNSKNLFEHYSEYVVQIKTNLQV